MGVETDKLRLVVSGFRGKNVVVLGDIMLDHYVYTEPRKLSREAPVIVADYSSEAYRPGGAANLAAILRQLGANVKLVGSVGLDEDGEKLLGALKNSGIDTASIVVTGRKTCVKRRIYVGRRQYLRVDVEDRSPLEANEAGRLLENFGRSLEGSDLVVISDHDKGTLTSSTIYGAIELSKRQGKCVVARPKVEHVFDFSGADTIVTTVREASEAVGVKILNDSSIRNLGFNLLTRTGSASIFLYDQGTSYLFEQNNSVTYVPPLAKLTYHEAVGLRDIVAAAYGLAYVESKNPLYASLVSRVAETVFLETTNGARTQITAPQLVEGIDRFFADSYTYRTVRVR